MEYAFIAERGFNMQILKRNNQLVDFNKHKIIDAITKAYKDVYKKNDVPNYAYIIADKIYDIASDEKNILTVEKIQENVEDYLLDYDLAVGKAYIKYRYKRGVIRSCSMSFIRSITEKLEATNIVNQNANVDEHSFGGRFGEAASVLTRQYALDFLLSPTAKNNHLNNEIYIHDLDHYALGDHNCLTIPVDDLLAKGFTTRQTDIRPANSINTAMQLVAVIFQLQSLQQFGGVSASHLDWTMVPYVRKSYWKHYKDGLKYIANLPYLWDKDFEYNGRDLEPICLPGETDGIASEHPEVVKYAIEMTERELCQAVEGLYHNLNTLQSRSGNQLPFTSINYGTCTLPEGRMVIKALLEGSLKGVGKFHKTPIFPCGIFQLGKGINRAPGDPNYDMYRLALKSTAQRIYPNYANIDWSGNVGYDKSDPKTFFSTMGKCKL